MRVCVYTWTRKRYIFEFEFEFESFDIKYAGSIHHISSKNVTNSVTYFFEVREFPV